MSNDTPQQHQPSISDVLLVKSHLSQPPASLPVELIDIILDDASYWPCSTSTVEKLDGVGSAHGGVLDKVCMRSLPLAVEGTEGESMWHEQMEQHRLGELDDELGGEMPVFEKTGPALGPRPRCPTEGGVRGYRNTSGAGIGNSGADTGAGVGTTQEAGAGAKVGWRDAGAKATWAPPRGQFPCRKIEFELCSRDQGWSWCRVLGKTYERSFTWFDALIERADVDDSKSEQHPNVPGAFHLQRNVLAKREWAQHKITWHYLDAIKEGSPEAKEADRMGRGWASLDGQMVRTLKAGDNIALWMRSRLPGSSMDVSKAKITVWWAV
ncbi:hypothetical protein CONPUDRAFT_140814 [Coniophora puteana RWD-64-598 SS2]|uniref:Uncharacterized protein n=1 Tax=Coniophora puteana (strain RWD-64-598) TaxID=741705 RepID=A0A5M3N3V1_CONPW|nr:uncharacterized protein CONPUDRAFT_140814 [Coniophora puteana RWD-64-598 SS2]EIW86092.1 hypothetical protein CONPUDRAFT_140814 [Coniophora puteana RWD-64-598 SS2]